MRPYAGVYSIQFIREIAVSRFTRRTASFSSLPAVRTELYTYVYVHYAPPLTCARIRVIGTDPRARTLRTGPRRALTRGYF